MSKITETKLHLACGTIKLEGWINIDIDSEMADLELDLTKGLPFETGSVKYIYSEHFIEHVERTEALNILKECNRVLSDDGVLRISTPNLTALVIAYLSLDTSSWGDLWRPINSCHLLNEGMRSWGHQFIYNADELSLLLIEAGFTSKKFVPWGDSQFNELKNIESRPFHDDLIIEAYKSTLFFSNNPDCKNSEELLPDEFNSIEVIKKLSTNLNDAAYKSDYAKGLESEISNQNRHISASEQTITNQINHINGLEKALADQINHINGLEKALADHMTHTSGVEKALADQINHISGLENALADQINHSIELEKVISDQTNHINNIENKLDRINKLMIIKWLRFFSRKSY